MGRHIGAWQLAMWWHLYVSLSLSLSDIFNSPYSQFTFTLLSLLFPQELFLMQRLCHLAHVVSMVFLFLPSATVHSGRTELWTDCP